MLLISQVIGQNLWQRHFGEMNDVETGFELAITCNRVFVIGNTTISMSPRGKLMVLDTLGNVITDSTYTGFNSSTSLWSLAASPTDCSVYIGGVTAVSGDTVSNRGLLMKINESGDTLWTKYYFLGAETKLISVQLDEDNGKLFSLVEYKIQSGPGNTDYCLMSTDLNGNIINQVFLSEYYSSFFSKITLIDSICYVLGTISVNSSWTGCILKYNQSLDSSGIILLPEWQQIRITDLVIADSSSYVAGVFQSLYYLGKFNNNTEIIDWQKFNCANCQFQSIKNITILDSTIICIGSKGDGYPNNNGFIMFLTTGGDSLGLINHDAFTPSGLVNSLVYNNSIYAIGNISVYDLTNNPDIWILKTDLNGNTGPFVSVEQNESGLNPDIPVMYPIPGSGRFNLRSPNSFPEVSEINAFNIHGKEVEVHEYQGGSYQLESTEPGIYLIGFRINEIWYYKKLIVR